MNLPARKVFFWLLRLSGYKHSCRLPRAAHFKDAWDTFCSQATCSYERNRLMIHSWLDPEVPYPPDVPDTGDKKRKEKKNGSSVQ